ncbi:hypothetical protein [Vibrio fluvialis]|uniref:hypothetical protein n=1 Tax=Vibrio fluvialis TaxID=676 RepID=UPI001302E5A6|nr:hypothetical protein [Vibrio fluvialis]
MRNTLTNFTLTTLAIVVSTQCLSANSDAEAWVSSVNPGFTDQFKNSDPSTVPNYTEGVTYSDDPQTIKQESLKDSQTDEAAQLIYSLGRKPDIKSENWFQNASDITDDPTSVIDLGDTGYTDCDEITQPGGEYNTEESCTITAIPETRSCSYGPEVEVDSHYLYECMKQRDMTNETCSVGREIDVTQNHNYACRQGEDVYSKMCQKTLDVKVEKALYSYTPTAICTFQSSQFNPYGLDTKYLSLAKGTYFAFKDRQVNPYVYSYRKPANSCTVYEKRSSSYDAGSWKAIFSGAESVGCRAGDSLWDDGLCHSNEPVQFTNALESCTASSYANGVCVSQPVWVSDYIYSTNKSAARYAFENGYGSNSVTWALRNGSNAYYYVEFKTKPREGTTYTASLVGSSSGYPSSATVKWGAARGSLGPRTTLASVSIYLSKEEATAATVTCNGSQLISGTKMCATLNTVPETKITDTWVESCQ